MQTQEDSTYRTVALVNLKAMCNEISGMCHTYSVVDVKDHTVSIEYSNPDEYGNNAPITAVLPCYPSTWPGDEDNPRVVFTIIGDDAPDDVDAYQCFTPVFDCRTRWRDPATGQWS